MKDLKYKKIVVIGDVIVDYYRIMNASRVSPEAPVLILEPLEEYLLPGGASNVVNNLLSFGCNPDLVYLSSVVGSDYDNYFFNRFNFKFPGNSLLIKDKNRITTIKERVVTKRQQLLRIDRQSRSEISSSVSEKLYKKILPIIKECDCIVFSDYEHGVLNYDFVNKIISFSSKNNIPVIVDSKAFDTIEKYKGSTIILPNRKEARSFIPTLDTSKNDKDIALELLDKMSLEAVAMTVGSDGIIFVSKDVCKTFPPLEQDTEDEVIDVTGAGDTVTASVAAGIATGMPYNDIMKFANIAAGIVVQKNGVATASMEEITEASKNNVK